MLHRSIKKRISLLPQWFMKVITPTLTCFPKKQSACSDKLAKCSSCAPGEHPEPAADTVLSNRTGNAGTCGGDRTHMGPAAAKDTLQAAAAARRRGWAGLLLCHTSCHEEHRELGWSQGPQWSSLLPCQPRSSISPRRAACSCSPDPAHLSPHLPVRLTHAHVLALTFFFPVGRRHLI